MQKAGAHRSEVGWLAGRSGTWAVAAGTTDILSAWYSGDD